MRIWGVVVRVGKREWVSSASALEDWVFSWAARSRVEASLGVSEGWGASGSGVGSESCFCFLEGGRSFSLRPGIAPSTRSSHTRFRSSVSGMFVFMRSSRSAGSRSSAFLRSKRSARFWEERADLRRTLWDWRWSLLGIVNVRDVFWEVDVFLAVRAMFAVGVRGELCVVWGEFGVECRRRTLSPRHSICGMKSWHASPHQGFSLHGNNSTPSSCTENDTAMITATTWVPRGFAAEFPQRVDITEEEYGRIADLARLQLEDAQGDLDDARAEEEEDDKVQKKGKKKKNKNKQTVEMKDAAEDDKEESVFPPRVRTQN